MNPDYDRDATQELPDYWLSARDWFEAGVYRSLFPEYERPSGYYAAHPEALQRARELARLERERGRLRSDA
jgi:hypothetical protein